MVGRLEQLMRINEKKEHLLPEMDKVFEKLNEADKILNDEADQIPGDGTTKREAPQRLQETGL